MKEDELINFACVLRGEAKDVKRIKKYLIQEYVKKGLIKMINPMYKKEEIHLLTDAQWKECQKLKRMIGAGFP